MKETTFNTQTSRPQDSERDRDYHRHNSTSLKHKNSSYDRESINKDFEIIDRHEVNHLSANYSPKMNLRSASGAAKTENYNQYPSSHKYSHDSGIDNRSKNKSVISSEIDNKSSTRSNRSGPAAFYNSNLSSKLTDITKDTQSSRSKGLKSDKSDTSASSRSKPRPNKHHRNKSSDDDFDAKIRDRDRTRRINRLKKLQDEELELKEVDEQLAETEKKLNDYVNLLENRKLLIEMRHQKLVTKRTQLKEEEESLNRLEKKLKEKEMRLEREKEKKAGQVSSGEKLMKEFEIEPETRLGLESPISDSKRKTLTKEIEKYNEYRLNQHYQKEKIKNELKEFCHAYGGQLDDASQMDDFSPINAVAAQMHNYHPQVQMMNHQYHPQMHPLPTRLSVDFDQDFENISAHHRKLAQTHAQAQAQIQSMSNMHGIPMNSGHASQHPTSHPQALEINHQNFCQPPQSSNKLGKSLKKSLSFKMQQEKHKKSFEFLNKLTNNSNDKLDKIKHSSNKKDKEKSNLKSSSEKDNLAKSLKNRLIGKSVNKQPLKESKSADVRKEKQKSESIYESRPVPKSRTVTGGTIDT